LCTERVEVDGDVQSGAESSRGRLEPFAGDVGIDRPPLPPEGRDGGVLGRCEGNTAAERDEGEERGKRELDLRRGLASGDTRVGDGAVLLVIGEELGEVVGLRSLRLGRRRGLRWLLAGPSLVGSLDDLAVEDDQDVRGIERVVEHVDPATAERGIDDVVEPVDFDGAPLPVDRAAVAEAEKLVHEREVGDRPRDVVAVEALERRLADLGVLLAVIALSEPCLEEGVELGVRVGGSRRARTSSSNWPLSVPLNRSIRPRLSAS
jgi:hypothetical protein